MNTSAASRIGAITIFLLAPTIFCQEFCPLPTQLGPNGRWTYPGIPTLVGREFERAEIFCERGLAIVRNEKGWSVINTMGETVIPRDGNEPARALVRAHPKYFWVQPQSGQAYLTPLEDGAVVLWPDGLRVMGGSSATAAAPLIASVREAGGVGYFNYNTEKFLEFPLAEQAFTFAGNMAVVRIGNGDERQMVLISYRPAHEDWEIVRQDTLSISYREGDVMPIQRIGEQAEWILFNARTGAEVPLKRADEIAYVYPISEGLAPFRTNAYRFGAMNEQGEWVISPIYRDFRSFSQGVAAVMKEDGSCGYIGANGAELTAFDFTHARSPIRGWVYVSKVNLLGPEGLYRFPKSHELSIAKFSDLLLNKAD